jgi:hypothetical protein
MRRLFIPLLVILVLASCTKEKDATIVGEWEQIARYNQDASGQFTWTYINEPTYPSLINFTTDGKYSMIFREPLGSGKYQYDYAAHQLKLEDPLSGTINVSPVSHLDDEFLVIDLVANGQLYAKNKYKRK